MADELVRAARDELLAGDDDDPRGPAIAEAAQDPDAGELDQAEQDEEGEVDRLAEREHP